MIEITVSEERNSKGKPRDHYCLRDDPSVRVTTDKANGLNALCRKIVAAGLSGPAQVSDENGKVRLLILEVAKLAAVDLRECIHRGFYSEQHRECPLVLRVAA